MVAKGSQARNNTIQTVQKVGEALRKQWSAAFDAANDIPDTQIPAAITGMAGGDLRKARVIFRKYYLRREFPASFAEISSPIYLPPKQSYVTAIQGAVSNGQPQDESGACLYVALQQSRRGMQFNPDSALTANELSDKLGGNVKGL